MSRETVEMVDGRVYYSDDNWQTVRKFFISTVNGTGSREVKGKEADMVRFIAVAQSSAARG